MPEEAKMMTAAVFALAISVIMLAIGAVLAYSWGGGEAVATYIVLFIFSQFSYLLVLGGAAIVLLIGTDKMKAGLMAFAVYWLVSFVLGLLILMPYIHITFFPI